MGERPQRPFRGAQEGMRLPAKEMLRREEKRGKGRGGEERGKEGREGKEKLWRGLTLLLR